MNSDPNAGSADSAASAELFHDRRLVDASILHADWPAPPGVHALTTLRGLPGVSDLPRGGLDFGIRSGGASEELMANRRWLREALELDESPRWLRQVHGCTVVTEPGFGQPEADAAVSRTPGRVLAILTADCVPVVFAARDGSEIAAAHAGWRGLANGVLAATVRAMQTPPEGIVAWIGPAAGPERYEIGEQVRDAFISRDADAERHFCPTRPGHWLVDLCALARGALAADGVVDVHGGLHCTLSDPLRFHSHRRDAQDSGRMATLIWTQRS